MPDRWQGGKVKLTQAESGLEAGVPASCTRFSELCDSSKSKGSSGTYTTSCKDEEPLSMPVHVTRRIFQKAMPEKSTAAGLSNCQGACGQLWS